LPFLTAWAGVIRSPSASTFRPDGHRPLAAPAVVETGVGGELVKELAEDFLDEGDPDKRKR
jgi:hypothetical protein